MTDELTPDLIDKAIEKAKNLNPAIKPIAVRRKGSTGAFTPSYFVYPHPKRVEQGLENGWLTLATYETEDGRIFVALDLANSPEDTNANPT